VIVSKKLSSKPVEELTYEEAFAELESIVNALEEGASRNSLEDAMSLFERGQALVKRCGELLDGAEMKVRQLSGIEMSEFEPEE
jgi:exodeoxyribonuclease VII small subunit